MRAANAAVGVWRDAAEAEAGAATARGVRQVPVLQRRTRHVCSARLDRFISPVAHSVWDSDNLLRCATLHLEASLSGRRGSNKPSAMAVDSTGSFVAVGDCSGGVRVWDVSQTNGTILARSNQDSSSKLPSSVSLISWFKAHTRRVSFVAFTSSADIVTVSSGACVRLWSVTGAARGKVGKAFQSGTGLGGDGPSFRIEEQEEPEVSTRGVVDEDDHADGTAVGVDAEGNSLRDGVVQEHRNDSDSDEDSGDENRASSPSFGEMANQAIRLRRQRHGKLSRR
jgi:hypothetical protein